jgi:hypothetical protein
MAHARALDSDIDRRATGARIICGHGVTEFIDGIIFPFGCIDPSNQHHEQ